MKTIFGLILITPITLNAFEINRSGNRLILNDESCESVTRIASSLQEWTRNTGAPENCPLVTTPPTQTADKCEFDITECVPPHVVRYQGVKPEQMGPNCWNLSLVMSQILPHLRYSTPEEMHFYMGPPLCRALEEGEARRPGDVVAIRSNEGSYGQEEYHGFIYISDEISFSKNGFLNNSPYALQPMEDVYSIYSVENQPECRMNQSPVSDKCYTNTTFYRCVSTDQYLSTRPPLPQLLQEARANIERLESCAEDALVGTRVTTRLAQQNIEDISNALIHYAAEASFNKRTPASMPEEERFMIDGLLLRLEGLAQQLDYLDAPQASSMSALSSVVRKAIDTADNSSANIGENP